MLSCRGIRQPDRKGHFRCDSRTMAWGTLRLSVSPHNRHELRCLLSSWRCTRYCSGSCESNARWLRFQVLIALFHPNLGLFEGRSRICTRVGQIAVSPELGRHGRCELRKSSCRSGLRKCRSINPAQYAAGRAPGEVEAAAATSNAKAHRSAIPEAARRRRAALIHWSA